MKCTYFQSAHCHSCSLLDKSYEDTLSQKRGHLAGLFPQDADKIVKVVGLKEATGSRTKAKLAAFYGTDNKIQFGFTSSDGTPKELEECPLHDQRINALLPTLKKFLEKCRVEPYDLKTKMGELKYVLISSSEEEILIRFVLRSKESIDRIRINIPELEKLHPEVKVVTVNIQPVHSAILEGNEEIILSSRSVIWHKFDEFNLALGARSFFQVTPEMAKRLYSSLSEIVSSDKPESLIDLYCGVGAFSFYASRGCGKITGVEISREAIECAKLSAEKNNRSISFHALDVEEYLQKTEDRYQAVLVNPPRRGLNSSIISSLKKMNPDFIYYSSCNAETMKRDYEELKDTYRITGMTLFDMFPFTEHYETLMCLKRR